MECYEWPHCVGWCILHIFVYRYIYRSIHQASYSGVLSPPPPPPKSLVDITKKESIVWHSRKSLLLGDNSTWIKKDGELFYVTVRSFDGVEICALFSYPKSSRLNAALLGLYKDDSLAALQLPGPQSDWARKYIIHFRDCGLKVTLTTLLKQMDFLDVTLNLIIGRYWLVVTGHSTSQMTIHYASMRYIFIPNPPLSTFPSLYAAGSFPYRETMSDL